MYIAHLYLNYGATDTERFLLSTSLLSSYANVQNLGLLPVRQASEFPNISCVKFDWILDSIYAKRKFDESEYLMSKADTKKETSKGKKRTRSETPVKAEVTDDDDNIKPLPKKQKDGQNAKSASLHVPLDEGCMFAGKLCLCSGPSILKSFPTIRLDIELIDNRITCCLR